MSHKGERARAYILAHPDETKTQQAIGAGVSEATIALIRRELVERGLLPADRKARVVNGVSPTTPAVPLPSPQPPPGMLDHTAMQALADIASLEDLNDDEVQKRMLKQCIRFAFDPQLHADTRMSASVQWGKLRDAVKAKDLGPGPPMTREAAKARYKDLTIALADVALVVEVLFDSYPATSVIAALNTILDSREGTREGQVPAQPPQAAQGAAGATPAP
jgi:hypothetical protein